MIVIEPYVGVGPLKFGMSEADVVAVWGAPATKTTNWLRETELAYSKALVTFSQYQLVEVMLFDTEAVEVENVSVFNSPSALKELCLKDGSPQAMAGTIILLNVGIALSGFQPKEERRTVSAFSRGRWEKFRSEFKQFKPS